MAIKDAMDVAGLPTTGGSSSLSSLTGGIDFIPDRDAPIVARLRDAGVIIIGKTNIPDWSRDGSRSTSTVAGPTRNSYNVTRAPGGSSGGSAVAVATGMTIPATAEETGSSITNPASANSLVGIRPTFGLIPSTGVMPGQGYFRDVMGPLAKTVKDAAFMLDAIAGYTPDDPKTSEAIGKIPAGGYLSALSDTALQGARIGVYGPGWNSVTLTPETQSLFQRELDVLAAQGATLVADPFFGSGYRELNQNVPSSNTFSYDINQYFGRLGEATINSVAEFDSLSAVPWYSLPLQRTASSEADPATRADLVPYFERRDAMRTLFHQIMDTYDLDALVMPQLAAPVPDPSSTVAISRTPGGGVNVMGIPGVVVPGGYYGDGTPFATYFVGRMWDEAKLIGLAYDYEQATLHRVAPTLVPEPASLAICLLQVAALCQLAASRRRA